MHHQHTVRAPRSTHGRRGRQLASALVVATGASLLVAAPGHATAKAKALTLPGDQGTLTANVWRASSPEKSGNQYLWDWQVSSKYSGDAKVKKIRATWWSQATLKNSASISMGIGVDSVSAGSGSSWASVLSKKKYWENDNGATESSQRSNVTIGPRKHYDDDTILTTVAGRVLVKGDKRKFTISSGV